MRSFAPLLRIALASFIFGTAYGDSNPELIPTPVDVTAAETATAVVTEPVEAESPTRTESTDAAPVAEAESTPVVLPETQVKALGPEAARARAEAEARMRMSTPRGFHDTNKADPAVLHRQSISGYRVNTVRLQIPAEIKVTVRKDWYSKEIKIQYPRNPYMTWRGVSPDAFLFRHDGVVMEILPAGTRYVPETLHLDVPSSVTIERR